MTWRIMNELLNKPTQKKELPKEFILSDSPSTVSKPVEIANKFNDYFVNLGPRLAKQIENKSNTTYAKYLTDKNLNSIFLRPIEEQEVETEIQNLSPNKSSGYDGYRRKILRNIYKEISKPLTPIHNQTFTTGIIPDQLKIALVSPKFENYRPISVLTCFSKVLEKLMYSTKEKNNILYKHQYGFRKNRSTDHAISLNL